MYQCVVNWYAGKKPLTLLTFFLDHFILLLENELQSMIQMYKSQSMKQTLRNVQMNIGKNNLTLYLFYGPFYAVALKKWTAVYDSKWKLENNTYRAHQ